MEHVVPQALEYEHSDSHTRILHSLNATDHDGMLLYYYKINSKLHGSSRSAADIVESSSIAKHNMSTGLSKKLYLTRLADEESDEDNWSCKMQQHVPFAWEEKPGKAKQFVGMQSNNYQTRRRPDEIGDSLEDRNLKAAEEMIMNADHRIVPLRLPPRLRCLNSSESRFSFRSDIDSGLFDPAPGTVISFVDRDELYKVQTKFIKQQLHHISPATDEKSRIRRADRQKIRDKISAQDVNCKSKNSAMIQRKIKGYDKLINRIIRYRELQLESAETSPRFLVDELHYQISNTQKKKDQVRRKISFTKLSGFMGCTRDSSKLLIDVATVSKF